MVQEGQAIAQGLFVERKNLNLDIQFPKLSHEREQMQALMGATRQEKRDPGHVRSFRKADMYRENHPPASGDDGHGPPSLVDVLQANGAFSAKQAALLPDMEQPLPQPQSRLDRELVRPFVHCVLDLACTHPIPFDAAWPSPAGTATIQGHSPTWFRPAVSVR
jgi:hypothetical protein